MMNKKTILLLGMVGLGAFFLMNKKNNEPVFSPSSNAINPIVPSSNAINPIVPSSGLKVSFDSSPATTAPTYSVPSYSEFLNANAPIITTQNAPKTPTKKETTTEKLLKEGYGAVGEVKGEIIPLKSFNEGIKIIGELGGGHLLDLKTGVGASVGATTKKEQTKTQKGITYTPTLSYEKSLSSKGGLSDMVRDVTYGNKYYTPAPKYYTPAPKYYTTAPKEYSTIKKQVTPVYNAPSGLYSSITPTYKVPIGLYTSRWF